MGGILNTCTACVYNVIADQWYWPPNSDLSERHLNYKIWLWLVGAVNGGGRNAGWWMVTFLCSSVSQISVYREPTLSAASVATQRRHSPSTASLSGQLAVGPKCLVGYNHACRTVSRISYNGDVVDQLWQADVVTRFTIRVAACVRPSVSYWAVPFDEWKNQ